MQYFQSILIVVGLLAIVGVLIHGFLVSRREEKANAVKETERYSDSDMDDDISEVRIIGEHKNEDEENIDFSKSINDEKIASFNFSGNTKEVPFEPEIIITEDEDDEVSPITHAEDEIVTKDNEVEEVADLFIFNVVAKEGSQLGGHEILQFFLTSGFRFGEMSLFHRHENSDGTGPIIFSIANMMQPGTFDPDVMEQFKSEGVSFFLTAPNKVISINDSFEMMLRAVEQMAEEFDCIVLNEARKPMTQEEFIEYKRRLENYN
jgi:cell division protein ZipA